MKIFYSLVALTALLGGCSVAPRHDGPSSGVVGVREQHLSAQFWVERAPNARRLVMSRQQISVQNERLMQVDPSVYDLERLPARLAGEQVRHWIARVSRRPEERLYDDHGDPVSEAQLAAIEANVNQSAVPNEASTRYGLVVRRADLRAFPTRLRVFSDPEDADIDRFQESALFPAAPVAIVHESADREWWFVVSQTYAAWIEKQYVAEGEAAEIFAHGRKTPFIVVTGASVRTVFTRERPELSELQLDMGVRAPLAAWPANEPVNGQHPYTAHVVELPIRTAEGKLQFAPALVPKTADVSTNYLPLTPANLLTQSFKFLGERYGWGHAYNARDCSGFVSEVYRSFGVLVPRNTGDQASSPALERLTFKTAESAAERRALVQQLKIGDLIYVPRHVMMVIGRDAGAVYLIHDTTGVTYRAKDGELIRVHLNGVSVTPLEPLLVSDGRPLIDAVRSIVRIGS